MPITDYTQPAAQVAQAAAVLIGGSWGYAKYVRGRVFRPRAELELSASKLSGVDDAVIVVRVTMKNHGLSRLRLEKDLSMVLVDTVPADRLRAGANVTWNDAAMVAPIFERHSWLEPGETIRDDVMLPLPLPSAAVLQPIAYRIRAWVRSPRRLGKTGIAWSASAIVADVTDFAPRLLTTTREGAGR